MLARGSFGISACEMGNSMKNRIHFVMLSLLLLACGYLAYTNIEKTEYIRQAYKVPNTPVAWYETIAKDVNSRTVKLSVDGKAIYNNSGIIMSDLMELMIPSRIISETFDCAVYQRQEKELIIEKSTKKIILETGVGNININGEFMQLDSSPQIINDNIYIPITALAKSLEYEFNWNIVDNQLTIMNRSEEKSLPIKYDYRENGRSTGIYSQGKYGTCWAFASLSALETSLTPLQKYRFSVEHMVLNNSAGTNMYSGGDYSMSTAYLAAWQGPVLEEDDVYGDCVSDNNLKAVKHVQEIQTIEAKDYEKIKEMVYKYGGVQSSLYTNMVENNRYSKYYNSKTGAYCYIGAKRANHDVVIIGWDDTYSKENFKEKPENDGAFICQNSWGSSFGDNGVFYVSYYDSNIGVHNLVYTRVDEADNYDNIYQTDLCGMIGHMGYDQENGYFANVYTARENERLKAVSFYATGKNTTYQIYVVNDFENVEDLTNKKVNVASGRLVNGGYYTIDINNYVRLNKGERYAVIVYVSTPGALKPIAVEYKTKKNNVEINDGEGYVSWSGRMWENTEKTHESNICLKAFTNNIP